MTCTKLIARDRGFSLIELMIALAIVGILAAIAYPSYMAYVARGARAEAKGALLENAQFLERNFTVANRYDANSAGTAIGDGAGEIPLPIATVPRDGTAKYNITVNFDSSTEFALTATPVAGGAMANDPCGAFTLSHTGNKGVNDGTLSSAQCWSK
jgi:type IV pilus assembly protein PilE